MVASRIHCLTQGRRAPFFRASDLASADHPWAGFSFEEAEGAGEPMARHSWSKTTLLCVTGGEASLRWKHRGVWSDDRVGPGTVSIIRRDVEIQSAEPSGPFPMMVLQLDNARLRTLAPDQVEAVDRSLTSAQVTQDPQLAALLSAMCAEVKGGCPSGRLYGESMSIALLAYLTGRYADHQTASGRPKGLSRAEMRTLASYVQDRITDDVTVTEMAALVRMSPSRFARVFKTAFGMTPYRYVMRERVAKARELYAATTLSASQVAAEVGFSSQSHFVKVFRQFMGVTPKQYKAGF